MTISLAIQKLTYHGVKVSPVYKDYRWWVQVTKNGTTKTFDKPVSQTKLNQALEKTVFHEAAKL